MDKGNLLKLAEHLKTKVTKRQFDMEMYRKKRKFFFKKVDTAYKVDRSDCGSIGCALGWAPFVEGLESQTEDLHYNREYGCWCVHFDKYCERVFGLYIFHPEWEWCFSPRWKDVDNTPKGAARRIEYLVRHGVPEGWRLPDQLDTMYYNC